ncbi:hypothetical protein EW145_g1733 [Phellinidium pouzarii]|uniref:EXPERA domain-containing protein n=1 Tax=Phellinidium pouzarii TaxID=167371 RepID=A0A4S4LDB1_9AGAM|nr:hypothetical protein EW145_g1733 [Phellinidium pouzarii]
MDILSTLAMRLFAHTYKYSDAEEPIIEPSYNRLVGDRRDRLPSTSHRRSSLRRSGRNSERPDRTAWDTYVEHAPPLLPANAYIPGFEEEAMLVAGGMRRKKSSEDKDGETHQAADTESSDDDRSEDGKTTDDDDDGSERRRHHNRRSARAHARETKDLRSTSLPTPSTLSFVPSSLFGSTTRPASRILQRPSETRRGNTRMAASKSHLWISLWFTLTAPVILWDASYCLMRPRSFLGGDLHWIWKPYEIYQEVDYVYGVEAYNNGDGFTNAQSCMNIVETLLNLYYLYAQHIIASPVAPLVGFAAVTMTLSKTVLYWAQEYFCGGCAVGHNDLWTLFWFWILPNGLWLVFPSLILMQLARDISAGLMTASKVASSKKE